MVGGLEVAEAVINTAVKPAVAASRVAKPLAVATEKAASAANPVAVAEKAAPLAKAVEKGGKGAAIAGLEDRVSALQTSEGMKAAQRTVDQFYAKKAEDIIAGGISKEISEDKSFAQEVDYVRTQAQKEGRPITPGEVTKEALVRFLKKKGQEEEVQAQADTGKEKTESERIAVLEEKVDALLRNQEFLLQRAYESERDPNRKKSIAALLAALSLMIGGNFVKGTTGLGGRQN